MPNMQVFLFFLGFLLIKNLFFLDLLIAHSPFSIFDSNEETVEDMGKKIWINPDEESEDVVIAPKKAQIYEECDAGVIAIHDIGLGEKNLLRLEVRKLIDFEKWEMELVRCVIDNQISLRPSFKAFLNIYNKDTKESVFEGWVISNYRLTGIPFIDRYFVTIDKCYRKNERLADSR